MIDTKIDDLDDLELLYKVKFCRNFAGFRDFGRQQRLNETNEDGPVIRDRSRRHEAAAARRISPSRRQLYSSEPKSVIFNVTGGALKPF